MAQSSVISVLVLIAVIGFARTDTTVEPTGSTGETSMTTNATGTTINMTTSEAMMNTSTVPPVTTPTQPPIPTFYAQTLDGEVCMIISINAIISVETESGNTVSAEVPYTAAVVNGPEACPENLTAAYIELIWTMDDEHDWTLGLSFEATETDYTMVLVNGSYSEDSEADNATIINEWEVKTMDFASAPLGKALHCSDVKLEHINFVEYKFQPFAQRNDGKFGETVECVMDDGGLSMMWIIIIAAVGGALLVFCLLAIVCCCKRKRDNYQSV